ncbi:MAG TPA: DUF2784 family protein [Fimbriimonas sp.]|nr:DUF2784 family protein [Fimbriimonas sp.]
MPRVLLQALDIGFFVLHSAIVLLNVFGWMWRPLRKANLVMLLLTLASWTLMGVFYGVGYCVCTDWHFRVRQALGYHDLGGNYIGFFTWKLTGYLPPESLVRTGCAVIFSVSLIASLWVNLADFRKNRAAAVASTQPT